MYKTTNAEQLLEFDKIKKLWASHALTEAAKEKILHTTPCFVESELLKYQKQTTEAKNMIEKCGTPPIPSFSGIAAILEAAEKECCLTPEQLEAAAICFTSIRRLKDYLSRGKSYDFSLAYYEENLDDCSEISDLIQQQVRNGRIDDFATDLLLSIRRESDTENTKMHEKADQLMRTYKAYTADSFSTLRNGHICLPIKKEYRNKINGAVLDKSSSGSTLFIEPVSVLKHYEAIQMLKIDEENEEMRIRYTLTAMLLDVLPALTESIKTAEQLDFIFSKGKFSLEYDGISPHINTDRIIHLTDARHPLMDKQHCVPLSFDIGNGINGIIITGPNTGGKTVTLKTVALCCMMAQCGLHVPCKEADICMNSNYLCDIGDGQNLSENLSTFSAHLKKILQILESVNSESLVILDELGSGTDPAEGMGIAIAVLEELKRSNALFLVTTHYPEVKQYASETPTVINARMDFDQQNLKPLYKLIIGESGESCAFSIARRLGMPQEMLQLASIAAYGTNNLHCTTPHTVQEAGSQNPSYPAPITDKQKKSTPKIIKRKDKHTSSDNPARRFHLGDSVMVYPEKKIGIVCQTADEKGMLRVQLPDRKIQINHKRLKLHVASEELYPDDYDFSIIFDSVENRKLRHQMERKYVEGVMLEHEN